MERESMILAGAVTVIGIGMVVTPVGWSVSRNNAIIEQANILQEKGLGGEHSLVDLREVPGFNNVNGGFIFATGTFHGETTQMIEFAWRPEGDDRVIQVSQIPTRNVKYFIIDDPNTRSTVLFTGMKPELLVGMGINTINSGNANDYIEKATDQVTILTLSRQNWEKFRGTQNK